MTDKNSQSEADKEATKKRDAELKAAADSLAAQRKAQDDEIAQRRVEEDEALSDSRTEEDRKVASTRNQLAVAAATVQTATQHVSDGGDPAELRAANAELQAAVQAHLDAVPEPPASKDKGES